MFVIVLMDFKVHSVKADHLAHLLVRVNCNYQMLRTRTFLNNNVVMLPEVQYSEYAGSQCL